MKNASTANPLRQYFITNKKLKMTKWSHYFDVYHTYFEKMRNKKITLLEIGVADGGSLQMWKDYFGKKAKIIGVDIDPQCKKFKEKQITIYIGNQQNKEFLRSLAKKEGPFDIVIDDGGHFMKQQIITFQELFPKIKSNGIFITEDTHTSYQHSFEGGFKKKGTFIEYAKTLIDQIHATHSKDNDLKESPFIKTIKGIHFYNGIVVFEKENIKSPDSQTSGKLSLRQTHKAKNILNHFKKLIQFIVNIKSIYFSYMPSD